MNRIWRHLWYGTSTSTSLSDYYFYDETNNETNNETRHLSWDSWYDMIDEVVTDPFSVDYHLLATLVKCRQNFMDERIFRGAIRSDDIYAFMTICGALGPKRLSQLGNIFDIFAFTRIEPDTPRKMPGQNIILSLFKYAYRLFAFARFNTDHFVPIKQRFLSRVIEYGDIRVLTALETHYRWETCSKYDMDLAEYHGHTHILHHLHDKWHVCIKDVDAPGR